MLQAGYASRESAHVTSRPASRSTEPVRRTTSGGDRASSFGFELAERQALARGEREVLARLFDLSFERIHGYLARMVRDEHLAEDLTSETFLRIQRGLATYQPERALRPWLFTIASNVLRDHFSARRELAADVDELASRGEEPESRAEAPEHGVARDECARAAADAIAQLSDQARAVLLLRHYEQLSFAEVGAALRISEDTARQRYARAIAKLRSRLANHAPADGDDA